MSQPTALRLLVTDMDSTLINIECIDEIADYLQIKPKVAAITEAAMRGELDFAASLRQRVALLAGMPVKVLQQVYDERLRLNPHAESAIAAMRAHGIKVGLVSGGFTFFTERLRERLQLDFTLANQLEIANEQLTGRVLGDIVDAQAKARFLLTCCEQLGIPPSASIAVGDGANDLPMLQQAGLSIAYHAKPILRQAAQVSIDEGGWEKIAALAGVPA